MTTSPNNFKWLLDAGHGGMKNGKYTIAPAKMHVFNDGLIFYEGVNNDYGATLVARAGESVLCNTDTRALLSLHLRKYATTMCSASCYRFCFAVIRTFDQIFQRARATSARHQGSRALLGQARRKNVTTEAARFNCFVSTP